MTPKRLRLIAKIIREWHQADQASRTAIAIELENHAEDLEYGKFQEPPIVKLREPDPPRTVFNDLEKTFPEASKGMR